MKNQGFYIGFVKNVDLVNKMYILEVMERLLKGQQTMENKETLFNDLLMEDYFDTKFADTENNELKRKIEEFRSQYNRTEVSEQKAAEHEYEMMTKEKANKPNKLIEAFDQQLSIEDEGKTGGKKRKSRKQKKSKRKSRKARKSQTRRKSHKRRR